jgi:hypothetical protein
LELLLMFDAHCRHRPEETVRNARRLKPRADEKYTSWQQLVLTPTAPTPGTNRGPADLRARRISEAFKELEKQHLVSIERRGTRRRYDAIRLLSEASTPEEHPRYTVPAADRFKAVPVPREFFTNLWVFALTDTELAVYLTMRWLRQKYPREHAGNGVFLDAERRANTFGLTDAAWRSTATLHRFGLIDRIPDPKRDFRTGNLKGDAKKAKKMFENREVPPVRYTVDNGALEIPALDKVHQVLTAPTAADWARRNDVPLVDGSDLLIVQPGQIIH